MKRHILKKKEILKHKFNNLDFNFKVDEIIDSDSDNDNEEKEEENTFLNLTDELIEVKKKDIKIFVENNKDLINSLNEENRNKILEIIKNKLYD